LSFCEEENILRLFGVKRVMEKKELAWNRFQASSVDFISYVSLVPIAVVMVTMVAVINPVSTGPVE
jgi:hypothetical protein